MKNLDKAKEEYCIGTSICVIANNMADKTASIAMSKVGAAMVLSSSSLLFGNEGDYPCGTGYELFLEWLQKKAPKPPIPLGNLKIDRNKDVLFASSKPLPPIKIDTSDALNYLSKLNKLTTIPELKDKVSQISKTVSL